MAKIFTIFFWILTSLNFYDNLPLSTLKYVFCIFPNLGLTFAMQIIFQYERSSKTLDLILLSICNFFFKSIFILKDKNLTFDQLFVNIFNDPVNLGTILLFMLFWSFIYIPIIWYFEKVMPKQFGLSMPWTFLFKKSHWTNSDPPFAAQVNNLISRTRETRDSSHFEVEHMPNATPTIKMTSVNKVIKTKTFL